LGRFSQSYNGDHEKDVSSLILAVSYFIPPESLH
jgi:hypothetical protein